MLKVEPSLKRVITLFKDSNDVAKGLADILANNLEDRLKKDYPNYIGFSHEEEGKLTYLPNSKIEKLVTENADLWKVNGRVKTSAGKLINKLLTDNAKSNYHIFDSDIEEFTEIIKQMSNIKKENDMTDYKQYNKFASKMKRLLKVQSFSRSEEKMIEYIVGVLRGIPGVKFKLSEDGGSVNIYAWKGKTKTYYPCVVAHTDTVYKIIPQYNIYRINDHFFAMGEKEQVGVGGDDKVGLVVALELLKVLPVLKVCFFWGEEIGCLGSRASEKGFFEDVGYILQADRKGNEDLVRWGDYTQLFDDDFQILVTPLITKYGYKVTNGGWTDVVALKRSGLDMCMFNFACGYKNPHSEKEIISIVDAFKAFNFAHETINLLGEKKYQHTDAFTYEGVFGDVDKLIREASCGICNTKLRITKELNLKCPTCEPNSSFKFPEVSETDAVKLDFSSELETALERVASNKNENAARIAKLFLSAKREGIAKKNIPVDPIFPINFIGFSNKEKKLSYKSYDKDMVTFIADSHDKNQTFREQQYNLTKGNGGRKSNTLPGVVTRMWNDEYLKTVMEDFWGSMEDFEKEIFKEKNTSVPVENYSEYE